MAEMLWNPSRERKQKTNIFRFIELINRKYHKNFTEYDELYEWTIDNIPQFWAEMWNLLDIKASKKYEQVVDDASKLPGAKWFLGSRMNFAENLLKYNDNKTAIIFKSETGNPRRITFSEIYDSTARLSQSLREFGVAKGDRVVGFMPNMIETVIAMLATTSIGAVWSSCSPDFGIKGVLDRFGQIEPKVLFTANGYYYNGKTFDSIERVEGIINDLPSIQNVIVVPNTDKEIDIRTIPNSVYWDNFISQKSGLTINFEYVEPDHPLYIMFTSGTTGLPKCMVQSTAGVLINQLKEHFLHTDVTRDDTVFYFTTSGWMMWNWLVCSLALGATVVLFDGSPFYPDGNVLWQMAQDEQITVFGTSAKYLDELEKRGHKPGSNFDLSKLKAVLSTGSPLSVESFEFVYREIKKDLQLSSISGGSDINGCWCLGSPISPVYAGEIQKRGLGMKMEIFDEYGKPVKQQKGELVITAPAPPMPLHFWNDPDGQRYHNAYFDVYPGVWRHGDFAEITEHNGVIMYGRSDATLNPGGVRIGTAEIYRQVENIGEIEDSLVIGQDWQNDVRIILFIKLKPNTEFNDKLVNKIRTTIRQNATPRHVPSKIIPVKDIPYTINMKKVEIAVWNIIHGRPVTNKDALANPQSLDLYKDMQELQY